MTLLEILALLSLIGGAIYGTFQISYMVFQNQARQNEHDDSKNEKK